MTWMVVGWLAHLMVEIGRILHAMRVSSKATHQESRSMRFYVLIVERDLLIRETILDLVTALGHSGLGASSPVRGLKMLEVMVFDAMMISPGATSLGEPSYAIDAKKIQPHLKVIMAAAVELPEYSAPPIDAFIQKPFSLRSLEATLQKIFIAGAPSDD